MNVLVACECSGKVRDAFRARGHNAWSVDLLPNGSPYHLQMDWRDALFLVAHDLVIAFPPCTDLCNSGSRWWSKKRESGEQQSSMDFFMEFTKLQCKWAIENPVGLMSSHYRKPDQIIQPWQFGHGETKATCLWLNGLPLLEPTNIVDGREPRIHWMSPGKNRGHLRSITYDGIAEAMAQQWG